MFLLFGLCFCLVMVLSQEPSAFLVLSGHLEFMRMMLGSSWLKVLLLGGVLGSKARSLFGTTEKQEEQQRQDDTSK
jgi:flagellar biosynthesis component FlhA